MARALFLLPGFRPELVTTIVTQATPHQAPPIAIDPDLVDFYQRVNEFWKAEENSSVADVTVFSSSGGHRDILVRSDLTSLKGVGVVTIEKIYCHFHITGY